jgi:Tfp pilus assembly protein PilN
VALAALSAAALAFFLVRYRLAASELDRVRRDVAQVQAQVQELEGKVRALEGSMESSRGARSRSAPPVPPAEIVSALAGLLPPGVRLTDLSLVYGTRPTLEVRVEARKAEAYDRFLENLGGSGSFGSIVPGPETRDPELAASVRAEYLPR